MSTAWAWSRRSILALQLLVEEWSADEGILGEDPRSPENNQQGMGQEERGGNLTASSLRVIGNMNEPVMVGGAPKGNTDGLEFTLIDDEPESLDVGWLFDDIFGPPGPFGSSDPLSYGLMEGGNFRDHAFDGFQIM